MAEADKPTPAEQDAREPRPCPICGKPREARYAPFCSPRCANVDLHRWLKGAYVVPGKPLASEDDDGVD